MIKILQKIREWVYFLTMALIVARLFVLAIPPVASRTEMLKAVILIAIMGDYVALNIHRIIVYIKKTR